MLVFFVSIIFKIFNIQFSEGDKYRSLSANEVKRDTIHANRGNVYAEDGSLLATSVTKYEIRMDAASPNISDDLFKKNIDSLSIELAKMLGNTPKHFKNKIKRARKNKNRYLFIARGLGYNDYLKMKSFPIFRRGLHRGGFIAEQSTVREHPLGKVAERTIGYDDYRGRVGIEGAFSKYLKGTSGWRMKQKIAKDLYKPINDDNEVEPKDGQDVVTTIDVNIQDIASTALMEQMHKFEAEHGSVVVMETKTGEIKAISNLARTSKGNYYEKRNYAVYESHEPGSTFKLMSLVVALEDQVIDTGQVVNTGNGVYKVYNSNVIDSHAGGFGKISVAKTFEVSSNIGIVKVIQEHYKNNPKKFVDGLTKMRLDKQIGLEIKGEGKPKIRKPSDKDWSRISLQWMAWGYGVSLTPLQTLTFYNAIANNGEMVKPQFIKELRDQNAVVETFDRTVLEDEICSQETIDKVKVMMENVVKRGTAKNIYTSNFSMAGKTGTAKKWIPIERDANGKKIGGGYYSNQKYISSFVGYFPADEPKYSCIVVIHEPLKSKGYYGATVAAPVFKKIAQKIYTDTPSEIEMESGTVNSEKLDNKFEKYFEVSEKYITIVPNVVGMPGMDAISILENLGLNVKYKGTGVVKKQSIKNGEKIKKGNTIYLDLL
ncbi:penicillin-binding protein [Aureivirga sp. CE67]|uniref:penicillin-binding protein n=1 Tax=Aureivirga sp. CE67 TaxID=1788983 RepID=UPI0018CAF909|nr:penicillin-binding protein [Aureivirga sp. CE67]